MGKTSTVFRVHPDGQVDPWWQSPNALLLCMVPDGEGGVYVGSDENWELAEAAMRHIPDARLVVLEESAHWPQWEEPELFNQLHLDFLRA